MGRDTCICGKRSFLSRYHALGKAFEQRGMNDRLWIHPCFVARDGTWHVTHKGGGGRTRRLDWNGPLLAH